MFVSARSMLRPSSLSGPWAGTRGSRGGSYPRHEAPVGSLEKADGSIVGVFPMWPSVICLPSEWSGGGF